jgi:hypothetical protein
MSEPISIWRKTMLKKKKVSSQYFQADQVGIDDLKNEFLKEACEFVYYRKGEWHGAVASIEHAIQWAKANPEWIAIAVAMYTPSKELIKWMAKNLGVAIDAVWDLIKVYFCEPKINHVTRKVICGEGIDQELVEKWEAICGKGGVVIIPKSQKGLLRYLVNEKRFAIFTRVGENDLRGFIGNEQEMIHTLREMFDREFIEADLKKKKVKDSL